MRFLFTVCLLLLIAPFAGAQTVYGWNFGTGAGTAAATSGSNANLTVSNITRVNNAPPTGGGAAVAALSNNATGGTTGTTLSTGYGAGNPTASGNFYFGLSAFETTLIVNTTSYISVTVTPAAGFAVRLSDFDFGVRSTTQGATNYDLRTSLGATPFATSLLPATGTINDGAAAWAYKNNNITTVTGAIGQAVEIRLYLWDATAGTIGNPDTQLDDISIALQPVPEPASILGLTAAGVFGLGLIRKRFKK